MALAFKWGVLPSILGPSTHELSSPITRDDQSPGSVYLGSRTASVYVTAWMAPDCSYCRTWWQQNLPKFTNQEISNDQVELIFRPLPETTKDLYVAQFLACLPDNHTRISALNVFMSQAGWMDKPIKDWPNSSNLDTKCMSSATMKSKILASIKTDIASYGLQGTPSFGLGNKIIRGNADITRNLQ
jgi:protein-disulfide isomerase